MTLATTVATGTPAQAGGLVMALSLLVLVVGTTAAVGGVLWGLTALTDRLFDTAGETGRESQRGLVDGSDDWTAHPEVESTGRYGDGTPEVETTVDGRRVVARLETAPGGTDRYLVLQTAMLSVRVGTGFEVATDDASTVVDRGPDAPEVPEAVWATLDDLDAVGGLTVDDRTGVVEHRLPDPGAVADAETFRRQAEALVTVAETVEDHAETGSSGDREGASGRVGGRAGDPAVETER